MLTGLAHPLKADHLKGQSDDIFVHWVYHEVKALL
jgi:hypothetical protein